MPLKRFGTLNEKTSPEDFSEGNKNKVLFNTISVHFFVVKTKNGYHLKLFKFILSYDY